MIVSDFRNREKKRLAARGEAVCFGKCPRQKEILSRFQFYSAKNRLWLSKTQIGA
jgi:hypothetical protein